MNYKYNYVFFNSTESLYKKPDGTDYDTICVWDFMNSDSVQLVLCPLEHKSAFLRFLYGAYNSLRVARYIKLPFKRMWYPLYFKNKFKKDDKPLCFVILNHKLPVDYLKYLKKKHAGCKFVMLHRDFIQVSQRTNPELPQNPILDLEMTYDEGDSKRYNFPHFSEYESKIDVPVNKPFESDVFFAGRAKDRLPELMDAYHVLVSAGLKVYFFLTGVPKDQQVAYDGIEYASRNMSYKEMLYHTVNTRCILEVTQAGQQGYTSRFLEAVIYGKKLLTSSEYIKKSKFYNSDNIQIVSSMKDIDVSFVKEGDGFVDYQYHGEFSPYRVIDRIEEELNKKYPTQK